MFRILSICVILIFQTTESATLSAEEFKSRLSSVPQAVLLDLRTTGEMKQGKLEGAQQLDYFDKDFESKISHLDKSKAYFLYCAVGGRSSEALELMKDLGFKKVYHLKGGIDAWKRKGYLIVK